MNRLFLIASAMLIALILSGADKSVLNFMSKGVANATTLINSPAR